MNSAKATDYDIVIAGGGMIGTSLGLALAPLKLRVGIVEAVPRGAAQQPSFDDRSTALSRSSQRTFEAMGLWPGIVAASTPIRNIHVSDKGRFGFSHIDAAEQNVEALGYVVINRVLGQVLQTSLATVDGLDFLCPAKICGVRTSDEVVTTSIEEQGVRRSLSCRLLVAADGANSTARDMIGISASRVDYEQWAVVGNLLPEKDPDNRAFERFTDTGPIAMLPIADKRAAFVWISAPARAQELLTLADGEFTRRLQDAFGYRLGKFSKVGKRAAYPLALTKANGLIAKRSVVVGNAAHGLHPVAAQGFNLGMRDVAALCDCILDAQMDNAAAHDAAQAGPPDPTQAGPPDPTQVGPPDPTQAGPPDPTQVGPPDPGTAAILENYSKWRQLDHKKLVHFTDGIVQLFGDQRRPVKTLRNLGMLGFDLIPGVRKTFARHTMGLAGRLPRLSRGVPLE
jgi:2-octaprenyl-6-methoxyphenol hydroxylase